MFLFLPAPLPPPQEGQVPLVHALEAEAGWRPLFDGRSLDLWRPAGRPDAPIAGWEIQGGLLHLPADANAGGLVTRQEFADLELEFEWRVAPGANSGVKVRTSESPGEGQLLGLEYQLLDDAAMSPEPRHRTGALYDIVEPGPHLPAPAGLWHESRVVLARDWIEHWLDGTRLLRIRIDGDEWVERLAASKFSHQTDFPPPAGPVGLQDHGYEAWFRNIRARDLTSLPGKAVALCNGRDLSGWRSLGDARYTAIPDGIHGEVGGGSQSFLVTERSFGDFLLEVDVRPEAPGNSGIQVRSHQRENGRLYGYQVEIDSSARSWSGGLYDEARRGWLDDLADNPAGRAAFVPGEWNRYRIECVGPWIRAWVNGVPTADHFDPLDLAGVIGLQVHAGQDTRVSWRHFRLQDLGTRRWQPLPLTASGWRLQAPGELEDFTVHLRFPAGTAWPLVRFRHRPRQSDDSPCYGGVAGLTHGPSGWAVNLEALASIRKLDPGATHDLWIMAYGTRLALNLDGSSLAQLRGIPGPWRGALLLESPDGGPPPPGVEAWVLGGPSP